MPAGSGHLPTRYSRTKIWMYEFARLQDADLVVIFMPPPDTPPGVTAERLAGLVAEHIGRERVLYVEISA